MVCYNCAAPRSSLDAVIACAACIGLPGGPCCDIVDRDYFRPPIASVWISTWPDRAAQSVFRIATTRGRSPTHVNVARWSGYRFVTGYKMALVHFGAVPAGVRLASVHDLTAHGIPWRDESPANAGGST